MPLRSELRLDRRWRVTELINEKVEQGLLAAEEKGGDLGVERHL